MTALELLRNIALWISACAILLLSAMEVVSAHSVVCLCIGIIAAGIVLPPVRKRLHRGIRYFLTPKASALIVVMALVGQLIFFAHGMIAKADAQEMAQKQEIRDKIAARHQATAQDFIDNKPAILSAIDDQIKAGNLTAALAASNKYDNADSDLVSLKLRIRASLAKISLQDEKSLTLAQRAAAYSQLAESEPANNQYAEKAKTLSAALVTERKEAADKAAKHAELLTQFSSYDGSHRKVEAAIKAGMNNPDSYQHVETRFTETPSGAIIYTKFRGTNGFGAIITTVAVATVDRYGNVTALKF